MIETKEIQFFLECADTKSFTKAAKRLYTSQSNVSKRIKSLEDTIGIKLFIRQKEGVFLTAEGKQIYVFAKNIMDNIKEIQHLSQSECKGS